MKYLVFSDIHGNVEALRTVLDEIDALRPDLVACLGDVVGYGGSPAECVELVDSRADITVCGNHDYVAAGLGDGDDFNATARIAIEWTRSVLTADHKELIGAYDSLRRHGDCIFAHGSPVDPLAWEYIFTMKDARRALLGTSERIVCVGHTHIPGVISWREDAGARIERSSIIEIEPDRRYLINVGSVGQPRDGISAASFALIDARKGLINMRRIPYDVGSAQERIRENGLPESLASRLALAR
ncbi:MAG: metallophosphoesterase family protein [Candidatus Krumholzibacteria bacterium]|nr:metallophosphoesterase family protein [Candidatus Krumholzibacteria bacterium]